MAGLITSGRTPKWGVNEHSIDGVIIDSYNESLEIKDYEQTDEKGAVVGYLVYDQTKSFDLSGTILQTTNSFTSKIKVGTCVANAISALSFGSDGVNCSINTPNYPVLKSISFSQSAGGAQTFNASGTIYGLGA